MEAVEVESESDSGADEVEVEVEAVRVDAGRGLVLVLLTRVCRRPPVLTVRVCEEEEVGRGRWVAVGMGGGRGLMLICERRCERRSENGERHGE